MSPMSAEQATDRLNHSASAAAAMQIIAAVVALVAIVSDLLEIDLIKGAIAGQYISERAANANDTRQLAIAVALIVVSLVALILFYVWLHRAYVSLHVRSIPDLRFSPGWSVGWFFIPILGLWKPYQVMSDLWKASRWNTDAAAGTSWRNLPVSQIVPLWWALWLLAAVAGRATWFASPTGIDLAEYIAYDQLDIAVNAAMVASWLVTVPLIRTITIFQRSTGPVDLVHNSSASSDGVQRLSSQLLPEYCEKCGRPLEVRRVVRTGYDRASGLPSYDVVRACPDATFYETDLGVGKLSWRTSGGHAVRRVSVVGQISEGVGH